MTRLFKDSGVKLQHCPDLDEMLDRLVDANDMVVERAVCFSSIRIDALGYHIGFAVGTKEGHHYSTRRRRREHWWI